MARTPSGPFRVVIAGGGIGGLTTALALSARGFLSTVLEQADPLVAAGAGIQLSPNATRILIALGLRERLAPHIVVPDAIFMRDGKRGQMLARIPLGEEAATHYGATYWLIHRGDLQAALLEAVTADKNITFKAGCRFDDFTPHGNGITVQYRSANAAHDEHGDVLVGADGLHSAVAKRLGHTGPLRFARHTAWRATIPADAVHARWRAPFVTVWLGHNAHVVHYPVQGGRSINLVAVIHDTRQVSDWSAPGDAAQIRAHFQTRWSQELQRLIALPERWATWSLYDRAPLRRWSDSRATLLGDAAHPMLPFIAQGGAMAIEDAQVLADSLSQRSGDVPRALRYYERARRGRTAAVQKAARKTGGIYHLPWPLSHLRNTALHKRTGEQLRGRFDWIYNWRANGETHV